MLRIVNMRWVIYIQLVKVSLGRLVYYNVYYDLRCYKKLSIYFMFICLQQTFAWYILEPHPWVDIIENVILNINEYLGHDAMNTWVTKQWIPG